MHEFMSTRFQGDFGPFNPSMRTEVPIWLAVNLRQRHKCRIEPPDWLSVGGSVNEGGREGISILPHSSLYKH